MNKHLPITILLVLAACTPANHSETVTQSYPRITSAIDADQDGIDDYSDILQSAISQIGIVTEYDTSYYANGFPPENSGACADVVWRALQNSGYNFKDLLDKDIAKNQNLYPQTPPQDPNINFRRVQNIRIFLDNNAESLTTKVIPGDKENLSQWQAGDIVTYEQMPGGLWHTAIVSDKRNSEGIPLIIHNYGQGVKENDYLTTWPSPISGHFRFSLK